MTFNGAIIHQAGVRKSSQGVVNLSLLALLGVVILAGVFLLENDAVIGKSYKLADYQSQLKEQQMLVKKMEIKHTEQSSMDKLQAAAKDLNLVMIDKVSYLLPADQTMALSR